MIEISSVVTIKASSDAELQEVLARVADLGLKDAPSTNLALKTVTFVVTQTVEKL